MTSYKDKILGLDEAKKVRRELRAGGRKVVLTNGCFDLLHPGHLGYLEEAGRLGDFLFLGLNSDNSVRRLKGPRRPVCDQAVRARMTAGLEMVDAVVVFDEDTPLRLIKALEPDLLVKGGDWAEENIVGAVEVRSWGGEVRSLPFEAGFSTTALVERIARLQGQK
ncbi:MAG: D-glycero-beta-D-manno-heptose 1-phosphate adenylyltransferase [Deltaproteobacteria bacterium]|jgi:D-beta-D-heptose 7-phosphate kinase/D-beta-D-heptose 1-phosphate adenosyltransferase|nr:D-glycero-beta-D-manno-heptose 1-phosphate adenylyltransferase [Deltaproteobacteria bacterium]